MAEIKIYKCIGTTHSREIDKSTHQYNIATTYNLCDKDMIVKAYTEQEVKNMLKSKDYYICNLALTDCEKIRSTGTEEQEKKYKEAMQDIKEKIAVAKMLDTIHEVKLNRAVSLYLINLDGDNARDNILYVPDNVEFLPAINSAIERATGRKIRGKLKVVGGVGLKSIQDTFNFCVLEELDLSDFYCITAEEVNNLFYEANIVDLNVDEFLHSLKNARIIDSLFESIMTSEIHIENLKLNYVMSATKMFRDAKARGIYISNTEMCSIHSINEMFEYVEVKELLVKDCSFTYKDELTGKDTDPNAYEVFKNSKIGAFECNNKLISDCYNNESNNKLRSNDYNKKKI